MKAKSRGAMEEEITQAVIRFEKEYMGRGPLEARASNSSSLGHPC
ncbi:MAG: DUF2294 domain-containing protein [Fimbriiglobus sp.]|nr:DUF2294 domain-containing protein [Fimbriiglobus sp.]